MYSYLKIPFDFYLSFYRFVQSFILVFDSVLILVILIFDIKPIDLDAYPSIKIQKALLKVSSTRNIVSLCIPVKSNGSYATLS